MQFLRSLEKRNHFFSGDAFFSQPPPFTSAPHAPHPPCPPQFSCHGRRPVSGKCSRAILRSFLRSTEKSNHFFFYDHRFLITFSSTMAVHMVFLCLKLNSPASGEKFRYPRWPRMTNRKKYICIWKWPTVRKFSLSTRLTGLGTWDDFLFLVNLENFFFLKNHQNLSKWPKIFQNSGKFWKSFGRNFFEKNFGRDFFEKIFGRDFFEKIFGRDFFEKNFGRVFFEKNFGRDSFEKILVVIFSRKKRVSQNFTKFCKILQNFAKFCKILQKFAKICKILQNLPKFTKICKILQNFAKFCWNFAKIFCKILQNFAKLAFTM